MQRIFARAYLCPADLHPEEAKREFQKANRGFMVQTSKPGGAGNELYLELLAAQTLKAGVLGSALAKKPEIDFLLRVAGTTQISQAIKQKGARDGEEFLLVVAGDREPAGDEGFRGLRLPRRRLSLSELGRVEKAALLSTKRA